MDRGRTRKGIPAGLIVLVPAMLWASDAAAQSRATANVPAKASFLKPLTITGLQDLDLGTVLLAGGSWTSATVGVTRAGARTCTAPLSCTGAFRAARFSVSGSNRQTILVTAAPVVMTNSMDSTKRLTLVPDVPTSVVLPNSGNQGIEFTVGGSIAVTSATADGTYVGTLEVTVDYQ